MSPRPGRQHREGGPPRGAVVSRRVDFTAHENIRRAFEIETTEDSHRVQTIQRRRGGRIGQCSVEIEALDAGVKIRRVQANNFCVVRRRLGEQVGVGRDQVRNLHLRFIGVAPRPQHMPLQENCIFVVGGNREYVDLIAVLNLEALQLFVNHPVVRIRRKVQSEHGAFFVGFDALHFDVSKSCRWKNTSRQGQHVCQRCFVKQFVETRATHHSFDRHFRSERRDK